jgi:ATP-dependent Lon protease
MGFPLQVKSDQSKQLIDDILLKNRLLGLVSHKPVEGEPEQLTGEHLYSIGVAGYIHKLIKNSDNAYHVLTSGFKKIRILEYVQQTPYLVAKVEVLDMDETMDQETEALDLNLKTQFKKLAELVMLPPEIGMTVESLTNPFHAAYLISSQLHINQEEEQAILETATLKELLRRVTTHLNKRLDTALMSQELQKSVKEDIDKKQREFFLRQQLQAIRKELGEDNENLDLDELRVKFENAKLSEEARKVAQKELDRLSRISPSSPEYTVSRTSTPG